MFALVGAFLLALIVVGTATLSGHPLEVIAVAVVVAAVILAVMWRVRKLSGASDAAPRPAAPHRAGPRPAAPHRSGPRPAAPRSRRSGPGRPGSTGAADD